MTIEQLREQLLDLQEQSEVILATANAEKRDLTEDEGKEVDGLLAQQDKVEADIRRMTKVQANAKKLTQGTGRQSEPGQPEPVLARGDRHADVRVIERPEERGKAGFRSFGEFAMAVKAGSHRGAGQIDPRLARIMDAAPTSWSSEGAGTDGGFAVPADFRQEIMVKVMGEESLLGRTDQITVSGNSLTVPKDETTPWATSGGVQVYWTGEGAAATQSKVALESQTTTLHKLTALVGVTEELFNDAQALDSYLRRKTPQKIDFKVTDSLINGTGAGQPLGIMNAPATVSVAKEGSQAADTLLAANIFKMWSRMYGPCRSNAVWLINQDIEQQLLQMTVAVQNVAGTENVGGSVVYTPSNGIAGAPFATLMGRPVITTEACPTLGDTGDIILADMSQYLTAIKGGGIRTDVSMHLWFDYDMLAYKFVLRIGGQPWWSSSITRKNGSNTLSCFVKLDERA